MAIKCFWLRALNRSEKNVSTPNALIIRTPLNVSSKILTKDPSSSLPLFAECFSFFAILLISIPLTGRNTNAKMVSSQLSAKSAAIEINTMRGDLNITSIDPTILTSTSFKSTVRRLKTSPLRESVNHPILIPRTRPYILSLKSLLTPVRIVARLYMAR